MDDISRTANPHHNRPLNPATHRNPSPHNHPSGQSLLLQSSDFDISDLTAGQDFMDTSLGGNSTKRKAQNRAAQRAFRERKERHVKDLEAKVAELELVTRRMREENETLRGKVSKLESENNVLKGSNITFTFPVLSLVSVSWVACVATWRLSFLYEYGEVADDSNLRKRQW